MPDTTDLSKALDWVEDTLADLPASESAELEYKSGGTPVGQLSIKMQKAASAFWNSGGGIFLAGVDDKGKPDGMLPEKVGNQTWGDWVDQVVHQVQPVGPYATRVLTPPGSEARILAVAFGESHVAPHMAPDSRYYVRAGAHTEPARHFLVEAIRGARGLQDPQLHCVLEYFQIRGGAAVRMKVVAATDAPALEVEIDASAVNTQKTGFNARAFPKRVPLISREHPFVVNLNGVSNMRDAVFRVELRYLDLRGRKHRADRIVNTDDQLGVALY